MDPFQTIEKQKQGEKKQGGHHPATTCDKINLKWDSVLEEHMIEKCTVLVDDMAHNLGQIS